MKLTSLRSLALFAALLMAACSGDAPAPAPAGSPSPDADGGGLQPLTSREAAPPAGTTGSEEGLPAGHPPIQGGQDPSGAPSAAGPSVSGTISLAPELASRVGPGDVLYVMAKKGGATLAVQRVESPTFPLDFQVSEGHAMVAGTTLEGPVDIVARLSRTGDAIPSAGDLEGTTTGVTVPADAVRITISEVRQ